MKAITCLINVILAVVACMAQAALGSGWAGAHYAGAHYAGYYPGAHGYAGYAGHHGAAYHGPLAVPVVLPSGYLADTHEVAAAKGAHLNALAQAGHRAGYAGAYGHGAYGHGAYGHGVYGAGHGAYYGGYGHGAYHGHQAVPVVLPSGYLADTHEVAAAKAAHLNALSHSGAVAHYAGHGHYGYHH